MNRIDKSTWYVDTEYLGHDNLIATAGLETSEGPLLVDPGPTTSLDTLSSKLESAGYDWSDVAGLLLTHIHLDHAGSTGTIIQHHAPDARVFVHERGAPHMKRPGRLLKSARRIYGDDMDRLWGDFEPVPEENVTVLEGGEKLDIGGRAIEVSYTPGHAQHHVSYHDTASGTAFIGDVGGMRVHGSDYIVPVMPPPDVDLPAWATSLEKVLAWNPDRIFLTHFGPSEDVERHIRVVAERIDAFAETVRLTLDSTEQQDDAELAARFAEKENDRMRSHTDEAYWEAYERFGQPRDSWNGLARYWRKHAMSGNG
ncbi:MBL fold metallo-hydrolase [Longibacter salinarum]|uniref:MBL fold metallo-hydrolase n=1 Tax=Longibacter salinarum TaxID=1850348 RepID=A0A2A8CVR9_9BACT|nr:MBL fold metallo-hydrolase [Longibacter salinarum]PEN12849.1 MBL fold metallo-hydrolase [Longibacter salinarum]